MTDWVKSHFFRYWRVRKNRRQIRDLIRERLPSRKTKHEEVMSALKERRILQNKPTHHSKRMKHSRRHSKHRKRFDKA